MGDSPTAVRREISRAVIVSAGNAQASGYLLTGSEVLTAGHALKDDYDQTRAGLTDCYRVQIYKPEILPNSKGTSVLNIDADAFFGTRRKDHMIPDVGLLHLAAELNNIEPQVIRSDEVQDGDKLYFIAYGPRTINDKNAVFIPMYT